MSNTTLRRQGVRTSSRARHGLAPARRVGTCDAPEPLPAIQLGRVRRDHVAQTMHVVVAELVVGQRHRPAEDDVGGEEAWTMPKTGARMSRMVADAEAPSGDEIATRLLPVPSGGTCP